MKMNTRTPRNGELNHELMKIITKHTAKKSFKDAVKSIELAVSRLAKRFNVKEFECTYMKMSDLDLKSNNRPWNNDSIQVRMYRVRSNRTIAIHCVGAMLTPSRSKKNHNYVVLSAPRKLYTFHRIDDRYDWKNFCINEPRNSLKQKWNKQEKA